MIGIADEEFLRGNVPMTKQEIRILTLAKAKIYPMDTIYDIGAGTGALSIEAARLAPDGEVFAIERNPQAAQLIGQNIEKFSVENIMVLELEAPEGIEHLPPADVVLIGGSGGSLSRILAAVDEKIEPCGRIVVNCITVQTLMECISYMREHEDTYSYEAIQVQVSHLEQVGAYDMARAMNPIHIVTCTKK